MSNKVSVGERATTHPLHPRPYAMMPLSARGRPQGPSLPPPLRDDAAPQAVFPNTYSFSLHLLLFTWSATLS